MPSIISAGTTTGSALSLTSDTSGELQIRTNNGSTTAMTLTTGGNVGVGTTTPSSYTSGDQLVIASSGGNGQMTLAGADNGNPTIQFRRVSSPSTTRGYIQYDNTSEWMRFATNGSERMRIDSAGNVGIGTSSPDVFSRGYTRLLGISSSGSTAICINGASGNNARLDVGVNGTRIGEFLGDASSIALGTIGALPIIFNTNNTERMRIDSSGNVLVGTTTAFSPLTVSASNSLATATFGDIGTASNAAGIYLRTTGNAGISWAGGGNLAFYGGGIGSTERMRITSSGSVLIGTTSYAAGQNAILLAGTSSNFSRNTTSAITQIYFENPNGTVGQIQTSGSSTSYITSSDYRLKENIAPMAGALAKVQALKPVTYTWKIDGSDGQGFIAHELGEVVPDAVVGEKDAVDEEGNIKPQGIDTSFLVATLTAAIQEQQAMIENLTTRLNALEGK
jgi:hypothetical protein